MISEINVPYVCAIYKFTLGYYSKLTSGVGVVYSGQCLCREIARPGFEYRPAPQGGLRGGRLCCEYIVYCRMQIK